MANRGWAPSKYPVREPTNTKQVIGRMVNPPRTLKVGGVGEARLIDTQKKQAGTSKANNVGPVSDRGRGGRK